MSCQYKNRTKEDALIYLESVFGVKSIASLKKNSEVLSRVKDNASEGFVLDCILIGLL